ncbi:hypothetical protein [Psychrobium sp. 1_MG-2023]|uniref:hypothetical protein n=1 Tax=Psychrobium sp. 1_MG-2023 TaxID=3062624 RepID=UPI000C335A4D|nr:hypothetical protein [Psychrobium sp. 1_MG-2023]MDP2559595.1 hypothetical protein [Psychrobium sp. 1_MG-2023]PKF59429.1 hypothetical protein CW748_01260 [Alteromonadales bacterium alter-6D02]
MLIFTYAYLKPLNSYRYAEPITFKSKANRRKKYVELPVQVTDTLVIKEGDSVEFGLSKHVEIWKNQQVTIPE